MIVEEALEIAQSVLDQGSLSKVQEIVFRQSWEGQSYLEIARNSGYELGYIRDVGCKLWQSLSKVFGKKVTKNNFHGVLKQRYAAIHKKWQICDQCSLHEQEELQIQPIMPQVLTGLANTANRYQDWGEAIDVSIFYGRTAELSKLGRWLVQDRCRLVAILGMGGIGKTALVVKLTQQVQHDFEYIIWRSLRNAPPIKDFLRDSILFLARQQHLSLPETEDSLLSCLMGFLRQHRCLLVLDNTESILRRCERAGRYCHNYEGYGHLLRRIGDEPHQSCLVLTSREKPIGIAAKEGNRLPVRSLLITGLESDAATEILHAKGLVPSEEEMQSLVKYYAGNPLALKIAATTIQTLFSGDVSKFLAQGMGIFGDIWELIEQQFSRLSTLEKQVMYWLATNREYVTLSNLLEGVEPKLSHRELLEALESLQRRSLIGRELGSLTQQSVIVEYMNEQLTRGEV